MSGRSSKSRKPHGAGSRSGITASASDNFLLPIRVQGFPKMRTDQPSVDDRDAPNTTATSIDVEHRRAQLPGDVFVGHRYGGQ